jgi:hypothetical protein
MTTAVDEFVADTARAAVVETAGDESAVGGLRGVDTVNEGLVSVRYECLLPGYIGWEWAVDLAVVEGMANTSSLKKVTITKCV